MTPQRRTFYTYRTPVGMVTIASDGEAIVGLAFGTQVYDGLNKPSPLTNAASNELQEYLAGRRTSFDLPLLPSGSDFQQKVWQAIRTIPFGETRTYGDIAHMLGNARAVRAVGGASNKNPIPILIPSHRLVGSHGKPGGQGNDLKAKLFLLDLEQAGARQG